MVLRLPHRISQACDLTIIKDEERKERSPFRLSNQAD
jgi:hypothetical protein